MRTDPGMAKVYFTNFIGFFKLRLFHGEGVINEVSLGGIEDLMQKLTCWRVSKYRMSKNPSGFSRKCETEVNFVGNISHLLLPFQMELICRFFNSISKQMAFWSIWQIPDRFAQSTMQIERSFYHTQTQKGVATVEKRTGLEFLSC